MCNPFLPLQGAIIDFQCLFGRDKEIRRIFESLNGGTSVALIGVRGVGKSSVLQAIRKQAHHELVPPRQPIYLNLESVTNEKDFYQLLCHALEMDICAGFKFQRILKQNNERILLILDEVDKMVWQDFSQQTARQLRSLAEGRHSPLSLIMATSTPLRELFPDLQIASATSCFTGIFIEEQIQEWSQEIASDFIRNRLANTEIKFTDGEIYQLVKQSSGNPQKLMYLCHQNYKIYQR